MLNAILKRTLIWSLPLAAAYLYLLSVYGPPAKSSLAIVALAFPVCAVWFDVDKILKASRAQFDGQPTSREAEVIWCWCGIALCFILLLATYPITHSGAFGPLLAIGILGRRLYMRTR